MMEATIDSDALCGLSCLHCRLRSLLWRPDAVKACYLKSCASWDISERAYPAIAKNRQLQALAMYMGG